MKIIALSSAIALALAACSTSQAPQEVIVSNETVEKTAVDANVIADQPEVSSSYPTVVVDAPVQAQAHSTTKAPKADAIAPAVPPARAPVIVAQSAAVDREPMDSKREASTSGRAIRPSAASPAVKMSAMGAVAEQRMLPTPMYTPPALPVYEDTIAVQQPNTERYEHGLDNAVVAVTAQPVSTFGLDVDTGSYSNLRRFLRQGQLPPTDAVRVEEMINYFHYQDTDAERGHPFSVQTEVAPAPWNNTHQLLRVRIKATDIAAGELPPVNLVFLVDVSGSMDEPDKLPLVKSALNMLVEQLRPIDTISMVVYAGRTNIELKPTHGNEKSAIHAAIARLQAGGSTAGGAAIELAYAQAKQAFRKQGINRILLATDGDFNVGITDINQLKKMVAEQRDSGITLTTLGFGQGNYNDTMMEQIADVGNGNYAYIDSADEARKVLVDEMSATLNVVAKNAKIQIEFNPDTVAEYRLIGYENRLLNEAEFNNDKVDAGDVGAGKSVTALYELTPAGAERLVDQHRYRNVDANSPAAVKEQKHNIEELAFLRIRYVPNGAEKSVLLERPISTRSALPSLTQASEDFRFASAVAGFGQLLRNSNYVAHYQYADAAKLARSAMTHDALGYRSEFVRLVEVAASLAPKQPAVGMND